jgi:hypothetical protein
LEGAGLKDVAGYICACRVQCGVDEQNHMVASKGFIPVIGVLFSFMSMIA